MNVLEERLKECDGLDTWSKRRQGRPLNEPHGKGKEGEGEGDLGDSGLCPGFIYVEPTRRGVLSCS